MSLESWKKVYYPKHPSKRMTKRQAIEHSLLKWTGLLPKNLEKHGLNSLYGEGYISEGDEFDEKMEIASPSCALCVKYYDSDKLFECAACPLYKALSGEKCDKCGQPYNTWRETGDPRPMIRALKKTLKALEE